MKAERIKQDILSLTKDYYQAVHARHDKFEPGKTRVPYAGRVFDEREIQNLVDASLAFWLTEGNYTFEFEKKLARKLGVPHALLVNSGSSANLLAFATLTSSLLKERSIQAGDEVITIAAGFPTTVTPIIQYGAVPVFIDVVIDDGSYNVNCDLLEQALSKKTKAVMLAHTLGNPFNVSRVKAFCEKYQLWLIEDNCDAFGSKYEGQLTGSFGDIGTSSFYPPHHMTMGEGGACYTRNPLLAKIARSMRDWGRDCVCPSGKDNTCHQRFSFQLGELPLGYDHKYVYSHFGYNLKATDLQASIGCVQLDKLDGFTLKRQRNWAYLREALNDLSNYFILPNATSHSEPSWFGFLLTVREGAGFSREAIVNYLEKHQIQTRMLFAGNFLRHPCFDEMRKEKKGYRVASDLTNTDRVMNDTFWVGVYPGMSSEQLAYMAETIRMFCLQPGSFD